MLTDKELSLKLKQLKSIKPTAPWQARSREILLSQIGYDNNQTQPSGWFSFIESAAIRAFFAELSRPVSIVAVVFLFILTGGVVSIKASEETKPGDTLYIAKVISEKAQIAITFDNVKKAKLNIEFASNRAEEIGRVVDQVETEKQESVVALENKFKAELDEAKVRISRMTEVRAEMLRANVETIETEQATSEDEKTSDSEETVVLSAALEKTEQGIEYYDPRAKMIEDAEKLFAEKDYQASADKLKELSLNIENPKVETVETVKATTTEEVNTDSSTTTEETSTTTTE